MKYIYCLKNTLTGTYSDPIFRFEDFKTLSKQMHDFVILYPDKAVEQHLNISVLVFVGNFDEVTGRITFSNEHVEYNIKEAWDQLQALKAVTNNA